MDKVITNSFEQTQAAGAEFAAQILRQQPAQRAVVLALSGDLGAGKTTFLQGFAKGLGIEEVVNSPTFIVMKKYQITSHKSQINFKFFYHIDCYRLEAPEEILQLGFTEIISNPENIVAIEWPEKIEELLPKEKISLSFEHKKEGERELTIR